MRTQILRKVKHAFTALTKAVITKAALLLTHPLTSPARCDLNP